MSRDHNSYLVSALAFAMLSVLLNIVSCAESKPQAIAGDDVVVDSPTCVAPLEVCDETCVDTRVDPAYCGDCETSCGDGESCVDGGCEFICPPTQVLCGDSCVDSNTDRNFCGATTCLDDSTDGEVCGDGFICDGAGSCTLSCQAGRVACDDTCIDPNLSREFCGATTCDGPATDGEICGDGSICDGAGACALNCQLGMIDCGGSCIDPQTNRIFCGATTCADDTTDGEICDPGFICDGGGTCALSCPNGRLGCGDVCIDPNTDEQFCGATTCADDATDGEICDNSSVCDGTGNCATSCRSGFVSCGGSCIDPDTDNVFCGATLCLSDATDGEACADGFVCNGSGVCEASCGTGLVACGGACIDPDSNSDFCGATTCVDNDTDGDKCASGYVCDGTGQCGLSCLADYVACGGACIDPDTDTTFCGATTCADDTSDGENCEPTMPCLTGVCEIPPVLPCGNGILEIDEQCDDHGKTSGDGCSSICQLETSHGLMGIYTFEDGFLDSSGNGMDGAEVGTAVMVDDTYGVAFESKSQTTLTDFIVVPHDTTLDATDALTMMMWLKPSSTPSDCG